MHEVEKYIADGRILTLLGKYLQQDILDDIKRWRPGDPHVRFGGGRGRV